MIDEIGIGGFVMKQDAKFLKFGTDAMLLSEFTKIKKNDIVCDLGCGAGAISLLLAARHENIKIHGVEIVEGAACLAEENAKLNGIDNRMKIHNIDLKSVKEEFSAGSFDAVASNPPFMKNGDGLKTGREELLIARMEILCTIDDVCAAASYLLKFGGSFSLVHRPSRLSDIFLALEKYNLAPKRMRLVQDTVSAEPSLVLLEARKGGGSGMKLMPTLIIKNSDGTETDEIRAIYQRK
ncbi:MAG: tRNA1(Val) (adenine(37)-N6)-methyltransferase [Oscillospiraceae bacterium]|nr:tRNA1(Val) (adenine(37)-N6)-methyltransferase [Oscillospiraceae bacterium]